ncbi:uncharacterized protein LOC128641240 [Bombina bombina]|uniref:uncharacterized protein LOC128641240 n=1 Tax=Bombina bombina TaxID=8345 RepID=UPI00235AEB63|nr:uncharacterized protein LOC128641240 [Bombina bombina]
MLNTGEKANQDSQNMRGTPERLKLFRDYITYYEEKSHQGNVLLCSIQHLQGSRYLLSRTSSADIGDFYFKVIKENCLSLKQSEKQRTEELRKLIKGFEILELVCVHLFLFPWRKEIRTLKTFTGNFVYFVQPVIPEKIVSEILHRVGYREVTQTEYIIREAINKEEAKQVAFELFLARVQCEEIIQQISEHKSDCVKIFLCTSGDGNNEEKSPVYGFDGTQNSKQADFTKLKHVPCTNNLHRLATVPEIQREELQLPNLLLNMKDDPSEHFSDEFLNQYSDLNIAQKPIFPTHHKQEKNTHVNVKVDNNLKPPLSEKINSSNLMSQAPESLELDAGIFQKTLSSASLGKVCELTNTSCQVGKYIECKDKQDSSERDLGNANFSESPVPLSVSSRQGNFERSIIKLKLEKMNTKSLAYPIEETSPPHHHPDSSDTYCEMKQTLKKHNDLLYEGFTNTPVMAVCSSNLDVPCHSNKAVGCSSGDEHVRHLREPPSSTYIPPGGAVRQCLRTTDLQPEENHFQAPSPTTDMVRIDESMYKMNVDTREDFVIITKSGNLQR